MDLRKLDALVAKVAMGWEDTHPGPLCDNGLYVSKPLSPGHFIHTVVPFRPSKHIADAWLVVHRLAETHWWTIKSPFYVGAPWNAGLTPHNATGWNGRPDYFATASTGPLAICLAALKAYGVDVSEWEEVA